jgi:hypothetical protein
MKQKRYQFDREAMETVKYSSPDLLHQGKIVMSISCRAGKTKLNSVVVVPKRTTPTERTSLVGEDSAILLRVEGVAWSAQRIHTAVNLGFLDRSSYFHSSSSSIVLTRLSGLRSRSFTCQKVL